MTDQDQRNQQRDRILKHLGAMIEQIMDSGEQTIVGCGLDYADERGSGETSTKKLRQEIAKIMVEAAAGMAIDAYSEEVFAQMTAQAYRQWKEVEMQLGVKQLSDI